MFVLLLPFLPVAVVLTLPGLRALSRAERVAAPRRLPQALALAAGTGLFLGALGLDEPLLLAPAAAAGLALALPSFRTLMPRGTLRAARGLPSGIVVRGLLAVAFLGCDAFLPLALTELRGFSVSQAGLVISAASLSWSVGSFLQARLDRLDGGTGRPRRLLAGLAVLLAGIAATAVGVIADGIPVAVAIAGWSVAGLGIGIGYPSIGAIVLSEAPGGEEGSVSAALQLIETIGVAVFTGIGGTVIAIGLDEGWDTATALALVFAAGAAAAAAGLAAGRRVAPAAVTSSAGERPGRGEEQAADVVGGASRGSAPVRGPNVAAVEPRMRGYRAATFGSLRGRAADRAAPDPLPFNAAVRRRRAAQLRIAETTPASTSAITSAASASASIRTQAGAGVRATAGAGRVPSSSRAAASPPRGTSTSRGPAARKSGTSNPPERRASDGIPASSSSPCTSSASGWFCAVATRTGSPSA